MFKQKASWNSASKRVEESAATKLMMCEVMKKNMKLFSNPKEFKKKMEDLYSKPWDTLKIILAGESVWRKRVQTLKLGKGTTGTLAAKGTCSKGKKNVRINKGCRKDGAGRRDVFKHVKVRLKAWLDKERSMCHHVDKVDLVEEFLDMLADDLQDLSEEKRRRKLELTNDEGLKPKSSLLQLVEHGDEVVESLEPDKLDLLKMSDAAIVLYEEEVKNRSERLKASRKYFENFGDRIVQQMGAKMLAPGRLSALSMKEEEQRVKCSWRDFDSVLWVACFGETDQLAKFVANPVDFQSCRHQLVIGFSDQIPVWVKIGRSKQVYCEREVQARKTTKDYKAL